MDFNVLIISCSSIQNYSLCLKKNTLLSSLALIWLTEGRGLTFSKANGLFGDTESPILVLMSVDLPKLFK